MLLSKKKITKDLIDMVMGWRHSDLTCILDQEFKPVMRRPRRTWPGTSFVPPFPRRECPRLHSYHGVI